MASWKEVYPPRGGLGPLKLCYVPGGLGPCVIWALETDTNLNVLA